MNKKFFKYVFMLMIALMGAVTFTACGGDDDDSIDTNSASTSSLVGTWTCDNHWAAGYEYLTLQSGGSYSWKVIDTDDGKSILHSGTGTWTYGSNILTLKGDYNRTWIITQFSSSTMTVMDSDGDTYIFRKK